MSLLEAAAKADELAQSGDERELATLRQEWQDELESAARGSALLSVQLLSKDSPGVINSIRPLLHTMVSSDGNQAVRRLAIHCLRNGSPQRETILILNGLAEDDEQEPELQKAARTAAAELKKRAGPKG